MVNLNIQIDSSPNSSHNWKKIDACRDKVEINKSQMKSISQCSVFVPSAADGTGSHPWSDSLGSSSLSSVSLVTLSNSPVSVGAQMTPLRSSMVELALGLYTDREATLSRHRMAVFLQSSPVVSERSMNWLSVARYRTRSTGSRRLGSSSRLTEQSPCCNQKSHGDEHCLFIHVGWSDHGSCRETGKARRI